MKRIALLMAILLALPGAAFGEQFAKVGTFGAQFLQIGVSARGTGMGSHGKGRDTICCDRLLQLDERQVCRVGFTIPTKMRIRKLR